LILLLLSAGAIHAHAEVTEAPAMATPSSQAAAPKAPKVKFRVIPDAGASNLALIQSVEKARKGLGERPVDIPDVEKWSARLSEALRQGGFPLGQVLMTQDDWLKAIRTGRYVFSVFPGRISRIEIKNASRVGDARLKRVISNALCGVDELGESDVCLLQTSRLERATQLLQDIPGVGIAGAPRFSAGQQVGNTQVEFSLEQRGQPVQAGFILDNNGVATTGRTRAGITFAGNNVLQAGDAYALTLMDTQKHMLTGSISASAPLNDSGLRLAGSVTRSQYTVNSVTPITGVSTVLQTGVQYPFARGLDSNVWGGLWLLHNQAKTTYDDFDYGTESSLDSVQLSIQADNGDRAIQMRGNRWSARGALTMGRNNNDDPGNVVTNRAGSYSKIFGQAFGSYGLDKSGDLFVTGRISGQLASRNLDSSEQLGLGGPGAVRAYRADEGAADDGVILNLGLYRRFPMATGHQLQIGGLLDVGYGRVNHSPWKDWDASYVGIPGVKNNRTLSGYGVSTDWLTPWGVMVSLTAAQPFGSSSTSWVDPGQKPRQYWLSATWSRW
jgi:hemolysin activation/secretion protein